EYYCCLHYDGAWVF
nr:immunoglobulin light chain junction region [Macaca mulatta]